MIDLDNLKKIVNQFDENGEIFQKGKRNTIKTFDYLDYKISIKKFKKPHSINKIIYKYFRKSKARRSFEYGNYLLENGFLTPKPLGYIEKQDFIGLNESYYCCLHLENAQTLGTILRDENNIFRDKIIRGYAKNIFDMHQKGIEFIDNSTGNTLIINQKDEFEFYLVDLNRMNFSKNLNVYERMKNLSRLTLDNNILETIASEYSKHYKEIDNNKLETILKKETLKFHKKLAIKKNFKRFNWFNLKDLNVLSK